MYQSYRGGDINDDDTNDGCMIALLTIIKLI
jgi:hypothetical protein